MHAVVLTIHLLLALALILVVLLQRSEGGGLGMGGGGGIMTSRGAATALSKVTWALGIAFVVTSLALTIIAARDAGTGSVVDTPRRRTSRSTARGAGRRRGSAATCCRSSRPRTRRRRRPTAPGTGEPGARRAAGRRRTRRRRRRCSSALGQPLVAAARLSTAYCAARLAVAERFPYRLSPVKPSGFAEKTNEPGAGEHRMARYIFITGGVVSSLGKGLASAALGALLQARGYSVRLRKLDPYLNVDPGTMSPFEHGEVFVTDDGAETDLDLGHYERFTGVAGAAHRLDLLGPDLLERAGEGAPRRLPRQDHPGDPARHQRDQGLPPDRRRTRSTSCSARSAAPSATSRACRSSRRSASSARTRPRGQCIYMHLTLLPYMAASGELKTKPTQHSVKELRAIGIAPDVLVCRSEMPIPPKEREKLALFCNVRPEAVIAAQDLRSIYEAPLAYHAEGLDQAVLDAFAISPAPRPNLAKWEDVVDRIHNAEGEVQGRDRRQVHPARGRLQVDRRGPDPRRHRQPGEGQGRVDRQRALRARRRTSRRCSSGFHAILVPGGFGERGTEGKIRAAAFRARSAGVPYLGHLPRHADGGGRGLAEPARARRRRVGGVRPRGRRAALHPRDLPPEGVARGQPHDQARGQRRQGRHHAARRLRRHPERRQPGGRTSTARTTISERHRHRYEVDIAYRDKLEDCGLHFSGLSPDGRLPEIVEIPGHPWFIGVQFHPELKSKPFAPHPLFADFVRAALEQSRLV